MTRSKPVSKPSETPPKPDYGAADIEVLEGLEPVRKRPGMYVGGTDLRALHHLVAEVLDNAVDEATAGHAKRITVTVDGDGFCAISDDGRGIPVDPHPKFPKKSALEVILTTLHSGGKFSGKAYKAAGGLHGVGVSVVNALSDVLEAEIRREGRLWRQSFSRGAPQSALQDAGPTERKTQTGTTIRFRPDHEIFQDGARLDPARVHAMAKAKAYLCAGVEIRWAWTGGAHIDGVPDSAVYRFPNGLKDLLDADTPPEARLAEDAFAGAVENGDAKVEWAAAFLSDDEGGLKTWCNTVPTPEGGTHEAGFRAALVKGLRRHGELLNLAKSQDLSAEDVLAGIEGRLAVTIPEPLFQGQTKEKLASPGASRLVELALKDPLDHWLAERPDRTKLVVETALARMAERLARRRDKEQKKQSRAARARLPGKLADCRAAGGPGAELFIVEGDSAGGSAKQARDRQTQAILPLRGKVLNVASAAQDKARANQELTDLGTALGCGLRSAFRLDDLRYERIILMTDADVDGAHIAALLMTFFLLETPGMISAGRLYLAQPPLYRLSAGGKTVYAMDDAEKDALLQSEFKGRKHVEVGRFKGLGEMMPRQLKETTMDPATRTLIRVTAGETERAGAQTAVRRLMGRDADARFQFIRERAGSDVMVDV